MKNFETSEILGVSGAAGTGRTKKIVSASADIITYDQSNNKGLQFLEADELGSFFGVKSLQKQKMISKGRHPQSMPKDSELWHYSKLSTTRRNRIKKGHQFWDVINEENVGKTLPNQGSSDQADNSNEQDDINSDESDDYDEDEAESSDSDNVELRSHEQQAKGSSVAAYLASHAHEPGMDLHFLKSSSINSQLKDFLSGANSHDVQHLELKVNFKNSSPVYYGMSFILNNYNGEILYVNNRDELRCKPITKIEPQDRIRFKIIDLFNPSNPKALQYGDPMWIQVLDASESAESSFATGYVLASKLFGMPLLSSVKYDKEQVFTTSDTTNTQAIGRDPLTAKLEASGLKFRDKKKRNSKRLSRRPTELSKNASTGALGQQRSVVETHNTDDVMGNNSNKEEAASNEENTNELEYDDSEGGSRAAAKVCGDVSVVRIVETRKTVDPFQDGLSDERAMRYHSKQASLQGRWSIHSAALKPLASYTTGIEERNGNTKSKSNNNRDVTSSTGANSGGSVSDNKVYSLTPIFIQQDLYCIGTKPESDHVNWPMRSSTIIDSSNSISREQANEYRSAFKESAVVKSAVKNFHSQNKGSRATNNISYDDLHSMASSKYEKADYGCVRKVVKRGFPYDFSVDRKCVWRLCLFEQFSDNNVKLSERDKAAKRVMETATMAMKLSQLNREGARTHIEATHKGNHELPALVGGENFARRLREINYKTSLHNEEKNLQHRRIKEVKLESHFKHHMAEVDAAVEAEEQRLEQRRKEERMHRKMMKRGFSSSSYLDSSFGESDDDSSGVNLEHGITLPPASPKRNSASQAGSPSHFPSGIASAAANAVAAASVMSETQSLGGSESTSGYGNSPFKPRTRRSILTGKSPTRKRSSFVIDSLPNSSSNQVFYDKALKEAMETVNSSLGPIKKPVPKPEKKHHHHHHHHHSNNDGEAAEIRVNTAGSCDATNSSDNQKRRRRRRKRNKDNESSDDKQLFGEPTGDTVYGAPDVQWDDDTMYSSNSGTRDSFGMEGGIINTARTASTDYSYSSKSTSFRGVTVGSQHHPENRPLIPKDDGKTARHGQGHIDPRRLQLDRPQALHQYDDLSAGEQVVALHKTFHRIEANAEKAMQAKRNSGGARVKHITPSIARKMQMLEMEDSYISKALGYKERKNKLEMQVDDISDLTKMY